MSLITRILSGPVLIALLSVNTMAPQAAEPFNAVTHAHDPLMVKEGAWYYVFSTGPGIPIRRSKDLAHWEPAGRAFETNIPPSAMAEFPDARSTWAPDVTFFNGKYHLYYSVSHFGTNTSYIGLATNTTLDPANKYYRWVDEGKVIGSTRTDNYNAIDANTVLLGKDKAALCFGSFWSGVKLVDLDWKTGKPAAGAELVALAERPDSSAIEGPYIIKHGAWLYLFVSFDLCCRGVNSTYNIRVGRSARVRGPYVDKEGRPMLDGGGTLLLGTEGSAIGPGHCSVYRDSKRCLLVYHFYDGNNGGVPTLQIRPMSFDKAGWPVLGAPLISPSGSPAPAG